MKWLCHRGVRSRASLWGYPLIASVLVHTSVLVFMFFMYRGYCSDMNIVMVGKHHDAAVIFLPLCKRVGSVVHQATSSTRKPIAACAGMASKKTTVAMSNEPKKQKASAKKKHDTKKDQAKKDQAKKNAVKKPVKQSASIKKQPDKAPVKGTQEKAKDAIKPHETPVMPQQKKEAMPVPLEKVVEEHIANEVSVQDHVLAVNSDATQPVYIGQAERDFLLMHEQIQHELEQCWRPPAGIKTHVACHIRVIVDWCGKACKTSVEQSSGIRIYDMSARSALNALAFPRSAYGKEIVIHFST